MTEMPYWQEAGDYVDELRDEILALRARIALALKYIEKQQDADGWLGGHVDDAVRVLGGEEPHYDM
jgi:hypothetical protein